ncbi:MAG: HAD family hydrolase, partial [Cyanobacteriota bacterium]|nr:HAD family hydrolase [Cyanobacteriota bacterium]
MSGQPLYILLLNIHGLVRGRHLELGRDADTGGQTKYVLELAQALSRHPEVKRVDLMTRLLVDPQLSADYGQPREVLNDKAQIIRVSCGILEYLPKEELWDYLDNFADNAIAYL